MIDLYHVLMVLSAWLVVVIVPGPDMGMVIRTSICDGPGRALRISQGMCLGLVLHLIFACSGLGYLLKTYPHVFDVIQKVGGIYLAYLGLVSIYNFIKGKELLAHSQGLKKISPLAGFLSTTLNPKVSIFFISIFSTIIKHGNQIGTLILTSLLIIVITYAFDVLLIKFITKESILRRAQNKLMQIEIVSGTFFVAVGVNILFY